MTGIIASLIAALNSQRDIYVKLYELSTQKREALERQDLDALTNIVRDEEPLLIQLKESERERVKTLSAFSSALGIPEEKITIQNIIDICPPTFLTPLRKIHAELSNALQAQVQINEVNRKLIEARLEYISFMTDASSNTLNNSYGTGGSDTREKPKGPRMIDLGV